ncbi:UNVERIFIED_CONTAM: Retrovirus-related Pol polyprotein from transposon TNT 1-94 [Sesamum indicum]
MGMGKGKRKVGSRSIRANDVCMHYREKGHWKIECPKLLSNAGTFVIEVNMITNSASWVLDTDCGYNICNNLQVMERSRKLSKDEVALKLGDGNAIAAEAVGIVRLVVSDQVRIQLKDWLGHISQDRIKRLVDSKILEIDHLDHLAAWESCLKGKMTKKPFVGQSTLVSGLLDLIYSDVCGPLNTQARGGFSYFITFTNDHSRNGYVYLMRYKSEAFGRFKEFRLEVENQTVDSSQKTQLNGAFERRNRTLLDVFRSMMTKLLNMVPIKAMAQMPYEIWHDKLASYKYLRVWSSPTYVKRLVVDKLDLRSSLCRFMAYPKETAGYYFYDPNKRFISRKTQCSWKKESSEATPQMDVVTSSAPIVPTNDIPILRRSTRLFQQPERYGFLGLIGQLDNNPKTYGEAMSDIDLGK